MGHTSRWQFEVQLTTISSCYLVIVLLCHRVIMSSFISSWHHVSMLSCHHFCQQLETFGNIWQLLTIFVHIWQQFTIFANILQYLPFCLQFLATFSTFVNLCHCLPTIGNFLQFLTTFCNIWLFLTTYCNIWLFLTTFDNCWQNLAKFGNVRQLLATLPFVTPFGNIWQLLSSCCLAILSFCHLLILSSSHTVIFSYCHLLILSSRHIVIFSYCHLYFSFLPFCHLDSLAACQFVNLLCSLWAIQFVNFFSLRILELASLFYILEVWWALGASSQSVYLVLHVAPNWSQTNVLLLQLTHTEIRNIPSGTAIRWCHMLCCSRWQRSHKAIWQNLKNTGISDYVPLVLF